MKVGDLVSWREERESGGCIIRTGEIRSFSSGQYVVQRWFVTKDQSIGYESSVVNTSDIISASDKAESLEKCRIGEDW